MLEWDLYNMSAYLYNMRINRSKILLINEIQLKRLVSRIINEEKYQSEMKSESVRINKDRSRERTEPQKEEYNRRQNAHSEKPERIPMKEKYVHLDVEDVFHVSEFTEEEVQFVEPLLDQLGVDLESPVEIKYFLGPSQLIYLIIGVLRDYCNSLGVDEKQETKDCRDPVYGIQSAPITAPFV
jgi:hypothetical protein